MDMVIGRLHINDGFVAERTLDPKVPIRIGLTHGGDPFNKNTPVVWCELTESTFASLMAHVARRGETGDTYREALAFLQQTDIEDEDAAAPADPLANLRAAKYLNPACAEQGCQWLTAKATSRAR